MKVSRISYTMTRGFLWDRLIIVKNRRTHRVFKPTDARCTVDLGTTKRSIPVSITNEGGIYLKVLPDNTFDYPVGTFDFDVLCLVRGYWLQVARGTLTVENPDLVTSLQDGQQMELVYRRHTDKRETINWTDANGVTLTVLDAVLQAKDANGNIVLDLRWFDTVPNEVAIAALPGEQRGYLAPFEGETMEIHISNLNTIPEGTYPFDILVQEQDNDWVYLTGGNIVVEGTVSEVP